MTLTLMPDGKTFKKLNRTQEKAVKNYYRRLHDAPLTQTLGVPIGLAVLGTIGAIAYVFRDTLQDEFNTWKAETKEGLAKYVFFGGHARIASILDLFGTAQPKTPEYIPSEPIVNRDGTLTERPPLGPFTICQRWENDYTDAEAQLDISGDSTVARGLIFIAKTEIVRQMKKIDCVQPVFIPDEEWNAI